MFLVILAVLIVLFAVFLSLDLSITASGVLPGAGAFVGSGTAGESLTRGQPLFRNKTDSKLYRAAATNANQSANSVVVGICAQDVAANQPVQYYRGGQIAIGANITAGQVYVLSSNTGGIAPAADLVATNYTTVLAIGISGQTILLTGPNFPASQVAHG